MAHSVSIQTLDTNGTQFERSRIAPIKAQWTFEREVTRHAVRVRPSSARPTGLRMALALAFPASLRGLNAPSPRVAGLVRAAQNQQQRAEGIRPRFGLERAERHEIPRSAAAQAPQLHKHSEAVQRRLDS